MYIVCWVVGCGGAGVRSPPPPPPPPHTHTHTHTHTYWCEPWGPLALCLRFPPLHDLPLGLEECLIFYVGSKLREKKFSRILLLGDDAWVKSGCNFATAREVFITRATILVTTVTVLVAVSSPEICFLQVWLSLKFPTDRTSSCSWCKFGRENLQWRPTAGVSEWQEQYMWTAESWQWWIGPRINIWDDRGWYRILQPISKSVVVWHHVACQAQKVIFIQNHQLVTKGYQKLMQSWCMTFSVGLADYQQCGNHATGLWGK